MIRPLRSLRWPAALAGTAAVCLAAITLSAQAPQGSRGAQQAPAAPTGPLAPEKYKNIQVLKDVPADQIIPAMRFVEASLGWQCSNCHVRDQATGEWQYDSDARPDKKTARNMMTMMRAINDQYFDGRTNVTCATCHAGHNDPNPRPPFAALMTPDQIAAFMARQGGAGARGGGGPQGPGGAPQGRGGPPAGAGPGGQRGAPGQGFGRGPQQSPDEVLDKYTEALGGQAAVDKLQSVEMSGTVTDRMARKMPFTIAANAAAHTLRETLTMPDGALVHAFEGTSGYVQQGTGAQQPLDGFDLEDARRLADLMPPVDLKDGYQDLRVTRAPRIDGRAMVAVVGRSSANVQEVLYFDADTGLLARRSISITTPLGPLPEQMDYANYQTVGGAKVPFSITVTTWQALDTYTVENVKPGTK